MYEFWLVWNPHGNNPKCRHDMAETAAAEAERLAREHPGQRFYIVHAVEYREVDVLRKVVLEKNPNIPPF
ncbi:hypothetical protein [Bordetella genomosp. 11]|uniref:Uncharacterized protein n=1 Tax=Bordetella genomosp. 11 TaxID=1416808 RepID=A0A261UE87_9BORD|nr:hypothetical protein [Bordetella genomosp. 11]OZI59911.1 hypothetical protein CAL28_10500 [Bordetella genomosp. 11]